MSSTSPSRRTNGRPGEPGSLVLRISGGRSPRLRWGERVPLHAAMPGGLRIDLSEVEFAEPTLALRLAASAAVHTEAGVPFRIKPPRKASVCKYLSRTGLAEAMGLERCDGGADVLMPITRIAKAGEVDPLGEKLQKLLRKALPEHLIPGSPAVMRAFSELCDNACTHGRGKHGMFLLLQHYGPRLVLAVGDLGIGIPAHLGAARPDLNEVDQGNRIAEALRPGVTAMRARGRGKGLPEMIELIRDTQDAKSELRIWSGEGRVILRNPGNRREVRVVGSYTPGTWAEVVLSSNGGGVA